MRERPILMNAPMVRAILSGAKTQTRRAIRPAPRVVTDRKTVPYDGCPAALYAHLHANKRGCPFGQPSDRLWVRETTVDVERHGYLGPVYLQSEEGTATLACGLAPAPDDMTEVEPHEITLRPSIHMPRSMCRLVLEIVSVRVERLQAISEADAIAEGIHRIDVDAGYDPRYSVSPIKWADVVEGQAATYTDPRSPFRELWTSTGGDWDSNPWVWVIEFKRVEVHA